jgi:hypothetical protein
MPVAITHDHKLWELNSALVKYRVIQFLAKSSFRVICQIVYRLRFSPAPNGYRLGVSSSHL